MHKSTIFILLLAVLATTNAIDVRCNFKKAVFGGANILTCFISSVQESTEGCEDPDDLNIVNESDLPEGSTLEDCQGMYSRNIKWPKFPKNIWKKFPNLMAIEMDGADLENLTSTYFFNLRELVHASFPRNKFRKLQGRLFRFTPKLKWVRFHDNPTLINIGFNLFGSLKYLQEVNFGGIGCGGPDDEMESTDSSFFSKLASSLMKTCPPDEEDLAEDMENMECVFIDGGESGEPEETTQADVSSTKATSGSKESSSGSKESSSGSKESGSSSNGN